MTIYQTLFQLDEYQENLQINLKKLESLEQNQIIIENLNENNQKKINEILQQHRTNSKQIKDKLNQKLDTSSSRERKR